MMAVKDALRPEECDPEVILIVAHDLR